MPEKPSISAAGKLHVRFFCCILRFYYHFPDIEVTVFIYTIVVLSIAVFIHILPPTSTWIIYLVLFCFVIGQMCTYAIFICFFTSFL